MRELGEVLLRHDEIRDVWNFLDGIYSTSSLSTEEQYELFELLEVVTARISSGNVFAPQNSIGSWSVVHWCVTREHINAQHKNRLSAVAGL